MSDLTVPGTYPSGQSPFDSIRQVRADGIEFWSARDLMPLLGYDKWERFEDAIDRAIASMVAQGHSAHTNASRLREPIAKTYRINFHLSRFACYLVAMNGDSRKPEVAAAQAYFAIRTREAETMAPALTGPELLAHAVLEAQQMLASKDKEIAVLDAHVAELAPKAAYVDEFVADEDMLRFATVASTLGMQESKLRELLIAKKWIYSETSTRWSHSKGRKVTVNRYSEYADKKRYFQRVENHEAPRFRGEVMHTLKITPAGAEAIARLVRRGGDNVVDLFDGGAA
ncbi:phage antirepressor KilAC domain-containing protein [Rhodococcus sp. 11-3]|uniref:phage antirepressor KilAC domain-containing protein n=1 Tax=Rhodococcus sp. 11-3 TaxID=2854796 RepID=UPI00203BA0FF|nr:phage antirepressor KilAC domain-containing protein [Rhodococcus sp. 11-3]USC18038.1 phage antirepressor KilAC domain-containing protein [Rhodococcus sp. 11-3]